MAKRVYNFEVFTNKKEQLRKIQQKRIRTQWTKRIFFVSILVIALIVAFVLQNSRCEYYTYKEVRETESNQEVKYESFAGGYLKYSGNGVEYQKHFGSSVWNIPVSYQKPYLEISKNYALLADKSSNVLTIFDANGKVGELNLKYPVVQASISDQGIVEAVLEGRSSNFIQMYDIEGNIIADMKSSVDETGYPLAAAISPDGTRLAVSYFSISGMNSKTTVAFYDFSQQLQGNDVLLTGGFDYEDTIIPKLSFTGKNELMAFGENATYYYNISDEPKLSKEITFDKPIESVFESARYTGYVLDNSTGTDGTQYRICLYNKSGDKKLDIGIDMNYDTIQMIDNEIFAIRGSECTIINSRGQLLFQEQLDGNTIESILPAGGWRSYYVIFSDQIVKMKLRFWGE